MALIRVAQYSSTPTLVTDYQAQNAHLQAFTNQLLTQQFILDSGTAQPVIKQGCYVSHGGSLYIADADTPITGSPSDGSVYIRVSGTTTLTVEFVTSISGYTWNPVYTALTSGSYTLLPYLIVKASTVWTRYNFNPNNQQFGNLGAVTCTSVNTGHGANEVYKISNAVYDIDQDTIVMDTMDIGEIRFISARMTAGTVAPFFASIELPPTGNYVVIITGNASVIIGSSPVVGGTSIAEVVSTEFKYCNGIIRKIL